MPTIPDNVEVFYRTSAECRDYGLTDGDGHPKKGGWYWWFCFPGCFPDSDPFGPFKSEAAAAADCAEACEVC